MEAIILIKEKIESLNDLIESYEDSIKFCSKNKDWILCNNYQVRIGITIGFINELVEIKNKLEHGSK